MKLWADVGLKKLVGCASHCPKQVISYEDLSLLVDCFNTRLEKWKEEGNKLKLLEIIDRTQIENDLENHICLTETSEKVKPHKIKESLA